MITYAENHQPDNVQTLTLFVNLPPDLEIFLCTGYTDLRKSIDGLIGIVEDGYGLNSRSKTFYCFCGRRTDRIKILFFDGDSYALLLRRTEELRYHWPRSSEQMWKLSRVGFYKLMRGEPLRENDALRIFEKLPLYQ